MNDIFAARTMRIVAIAIVLAVVLFIAVGTWYLVDSSRIPTMVVPPTASRSFSP